MKRSTVVRCVPHTVNDSACYDCKYMSRRSVVAILIVLIAVLVFLTFAAPLIRPPNRYDCLPRNISQFERCINQAFPKESSFDGLELYLASIGFVQKRRSIQGVADFSWKPGLFSVPTLPTLAPSGLWVQVHLDADDRIQEMKIFRF